MTKAQKTLLVFILVLGCALVWFWPKSVTEVITAYHKDDLWASEIKMSFFSDSTYTMSSQYSNEYDSLVTRELKGTYSLKNDTLHFTGGIDSLRTTKATIKNSILEFTGWDLEGIPITGTTLKLKPAIDPKKYPDFMIFTYKPEYAPYFGPDAKSYDMQEKDMAKLIRILETCVKDECSPKGSNYTKKCYATVNQKGEKEIAITFHLKPGIPEPAGYCYTAVRICLDKYDCEEVICFGG